MHQTITANEKIVINTTEKVLQINLGHTFSLAGWRQTVRDMCCIYHDQTIYKVLVNANCLLSQPTTTELFHIVRNVPPAMIVAVDASLCSRSNKLFVEKVAANRGLRIRVFRSRKKAFAWLAEN